MSPAGLYIHIPFCKSKCPYCDFYSIASTTLISRFIESLEMEMALYKKSFPLFDTLYIGGGTPSLLDTGVIARIIESVRAAFKITEGAEITIEANPGDMILEKVREIKSTGINRVNLGVQSFNDNDLEFLGRRNNAAQAEQAFYNLQDAGFNNTGIDLIYGLRDQSIKEWIKNLEKAAFLGPEHISCYQLTIEGKTVFSAMKNKGELHELSEESSSEFFLLTSAILEKKGYLHYEVSNFAKGLEHRSRHNMKYWKRTPYLGLGPSAHSFDGKKRWWSHSSVKRYCTCLEEGFLPIEDFECLTPEQETLEKISLGLRSSGGIKTDDIKNIPGAMECAARLEYTGYLKITDDSIVPTKKGLLVADRLPLILMGDA
ncbi:MAG: radical SAM family heme chaperone HemW [Deltaproteobacteria bacterium]|jgi:oxygen-independent coproporphyrinogen-3 oxidase|nr:radical SAM family heme chaperone HemW [Deltaproteobacteria bacterium]